MNDPDAPSSAHPVLFWGGVVLLNSLLLLPLIVGNLPGDGFFPILSPDNPGGWYGTLLHLVRRPGQDLFRLNVDVALIATALALAARYGRTAWVRRAGLGLFLFLLLYEVYESIVGRLFHRAGILYDDASYLLNAVYIALDLVTPLRALLAALALVLLYVLIRGLAFLFDGMQRYLLRERPRRAVLVAGPAVLAGFGLLAAVYGPGSPAPALRSTLARVALNAYESTRMYRAISDLRTLPLDTLYATYDRIRLRERPSIYVLMIESYGSTLNESPEFREPYHDLMHTLEDTLSSAGWKMRTSHSTAPIYGGRSWLSIGSVLGGLALTNSTEHTLFLEQVAGYPHLVRFLDGLGYHTAILQPPNRKRPGLPLVNHYGFDRPIYGDDLGYTGAPMGLWGIPDQHSINYAHETYLEPVPGPHFFFFETISTHAPWEDVPTYADDWRTLNQTRAEPASGETGFLAALQASFRNRMRRERPDIRSQYYASIVYDLEVVRDFILERAASDGIVLILGDHQPPIVGTSHAETPIHVLARDSLFLQPFREAGFVPGMIDPSTSEGSVRHEGLYALLVHALVVRYGEPGVRVPPLRPEGVPKSILVRSRPSSPTGH